MKKLLKFVVLMYSVFSFIVGLLMIVDFPMRKNYYEGIQEGELLLDTSYTKGVARYQKTILEGAINNDERRFFIYLEEAEPYLSKYEGNKEIAEGTGFKSILVPVWYNPKHVWSVTYLRKEGEALTGSDQLKKRLLIAVLLILPLLIFILHFFYRKTQI